MLIAYGFSLLLRQARISRVTTELISQELLFRTPQWAIFGAGLIVVALGSRSGFEPIARFAAVTFPFYYTLMLATFALALLRADLTLAFDPSGFSARAVFDGVLVTLANLQGYTLLFVFLPWSWRPDRTLGPVLAGAALVGTLAVILMAATVGVFGSAVPRLTWPTLDLVEVAGVPGLLMERVEAHFLPSGSLPPLPYRCLRCSVRPTPCPRAGRAGLSLSAGFGPSLVPSPGSARGGAGRRDRRAGDGSASFGRFPSRGPLAAVAAARPMASRGRRPQARSRRVGVADRYRGRRYRQRVR